MFLGQQPHPAPWLIKTGCGGGTVAYEPSAAPTCCYLLSGNNSSVMMVMIAECSLISRTCFFKSGLVSPVA